MSALCLSEVLTLRDTQEMQTVAQSTVGRTGLLSTANEMYEAIPLREVEYIGASD